MHLISTFNINSFPKTVNNMTHQNFEFRIRQAVGRRLPIFPDPEREEDAVQALLFYYSPWPHLEDSEMLRHQYGEVG